mmetsp:Transcript_83128/g.134798  ORF Transcript_83128/g.134798 Transcript_83128/m.134798 type:complete len:106 (-) Transcript_83128:180-497(-)
MKLLTDQWQNLRIWDDGFKRPTLTLKIAPSWAYAEKIETRKTSITSPTNTAQILYIDIVYAHTYNARMHTHMHIRAHTRTHTHTNAHARVRIYCTSNKYASVLVY